MSLGYAERLSEKDDYGGPLGQKELFENSEAIEEKANQIRELLLKARRVVVFTGAGISTSCGIPDFRGPNGVWTLKSKGKPVTAGVPFALAHPGLTHMAIRAFGDYGGFEKFLVVSQNVDGLHRRSGLDPGHLIELHGNCFMEECSKCHHKVSRDFEVEYVGFRYTGRKCSHCKGKLTDVVLDWNDALEEADLSRAEDETDVADVVLCLGTSLRIVPAGKIPPRCIKRGGRLVIVNLQKTLYDKKAAVRVFAPVDTVMKAVFSGLPYGIPGYQRIDTMRIVVALEKPSASSDTLVHVSVENQAGSKCPAPPAISSVEMIGTYTASGGVRGVSKDKTVAHVSKKAKIEAESFISISEPCGEDHCTGSSHQLLSKTVVIPPELTGEWSLPQTPTVINLSAEFNLAESLDVRRVKKRIEVHLSDSFWRSRSRVKTLSTTLDLFTAERFYKT